jgi:hypothetical protein
LLIGYIVQGDKTQSTVLNELLLANTSTTTEGCFPSVQVGHSFAVTLVLDSSTGFELQALVLRLHDCSSCGNHKLSLNYGNTKIVGSASTLTSTVQPYLSITSAGRVECFTTSSSVNTSTDFDDLYSLNTLAGGSSQSQTFWNASSWTMNTTYSYYDTSSGTVILFKELTHSAGFYLSCKVAW